MPEISRKRLEFAAELFLMEMRRQKMLVNPASSTEISTMAGFPPRHRSALMSAIEKAIKAADPATDALFQAHLDRQAAAAENQ